MRKEGGGVGEGEADRHGINQAVYTHKGKQADKQARRRTERVEITLAIPQKKKVTRMCSHMVRRIRERTRVLVPSS